MILGLIAVTLLLLLIVASMRPDRFRIERSGSIGAPPPTVFSLVNNFHEWKKWSPWEKLDPSMKTEHSGAAQGVSASYRWIGNKKVGEGQMTIIESKPNDEIRIDLEFLAPWKARNLAIFTFSPEGTGTRVTWAMEGDNPFMMKVMGLFMSMDRMIGRDFEKGLAEMKRAAEGSR